MTQIHLDDMSDACSAAEGATLASWTFTEYKSKKEDPAPPPCIIYSPSSGKSSETQKCQWNRGTILASAQNFARMLMDTPANKMTPTVFAQRAQEALEGNCVRVVAHDKNWAEEKKMGGFLSVTRGSEEAPKFLEMVYCGAEGSSGGKGGKGGPVVLVGKGVTFDSGGISLKPSLNMDAMRADMGGAACVVATFFAISALKIPVNLVGLVPLCENLPSGRATKPGDVVTAMNGKTICVDNTDAEGRLILADALCYSNDFRPRFVVDIATLTGAMLVALGDAATGVFTNSDALWAELQRAGAESGDRVWRFPLWKHYSKLIAEHAAYDVNNVGKGGRGGGACTAAAFLKEFVPENTDWMHLDMAGVMGPDDHSKYLGKGMKGRPTRTLVQFIQQLAN